MTRTISASYTAYIDFVIPKDIPLMKFDDKNNKNGVPWSWYVSWGTIHYFDADGKEKEIERNSESHDDIKYAKPDYDEDDEEEDDHQECQDCNVKNESVEFNDDKCKYICSDCIGYKNDSESE